MPRALSLSRHNDKASLSAPVNYLMASFQIVKKLADAEAQDDGAQSRSMLDEQVTADHIAQIVSRWTGVPVDKMLAGEREKLLGMEAALHQRVVGQDEAVSAVSRAVRRARAGLQGSVSPDRLFFIFRPNRCW